jgi:hypothetical protein
MQADHGAVEIRLLGVDDAAQLVRLAELDTADLPHRPLLGAMVEGRLVAAHSLATGESIADPFRPTAEIRSQLARRARQLRSSGRDRRLFRRMQRRPGGDIAAGQGTAPEPIR